MAHLETLCKLPAKRNTIPVLGTVKYKGGFLTVTDMDIYIHVKAADMSKRLEDNTLYDPLSLTNELFDIKSPITADDFPELGDKGKVKAVMEFNKDFVPLLEWCLKAASTESVRYYLNGVYFDPSGDVVATDGHRLHGFTHVMDHKVKKKDQEGFILPRVALKNALWLLKETNIDEFSITFYENTKADITIGDHLIETKLIDGTFPDWRRVVPKHKKKTVFRVEEWKTIYKEATLLKRIGGIPLKTIGVSMKDGQAEFATHIESQPVKKWHISTDTKKQQIGFNAAYAANMIDGEFFYDGAADPIVIRGQDVVPLLAVLVPLRV